MIRDYAEHVYKVLGPGYSERVYHNAMEVVLRKNGVHYETERIVPIVFEGHTIGNLRADLILNNKTVVELKSVKPCDRSYGNTGTKLSTFDGVPGRVPCKLSTVSGFFSGNSLH